jgi:ABC-type multidrug transport system ATPase subunit
MSVPLPETATSPGSLAEPTPARSRRDLLVLEGISKVWDKKRGPVLDAVDLELAAGALVSLIGPNGAGKTTLLRIVAGLIAPDSGSVRLDGLDPFRDRREFQRRLGFLSAGQTGLYARLSVRGHLDYWARVAFVPRPARQRLIERAIERFSLSDFASRRVDRLSMGQRQRARLAMAFLHEPKLVLLDEPQNSLDDDGILLLNRVLGEFTAAEGTAICCSPSGDRVDSPSDVLELHEGGLTRR